jgi:hypothetical protein
LTNEPDVSQPTFANDMSQVPHLPALRLGRSYESLEKIEVKDHRSGETMAVVSQVNGGIVRRDLAKIASARAALKPFTVARLIELSAKAGDLFLNGTLPLGDKGHTQSPQEYVETLSRTSGLPHVMVRRNLGFVLNGLSRGLDLSILDRGFGEQSGTKLSFMPTCQALGLVMPSNSPAVNSLWIPAIALKTPVVIKPGKEEPWTPFRLIQAFIAAGVPAEAFGFYPTDHDGAATILNTCGRALIFGDKSTTQQYASNPAIQIHGPGWSKFLIGEDCVDHWRDYIDVIAAAISDNGGRSCINASGNRRCTRREAGSHRTHPARRREGPFVRLRQSEDGGLHRCAARRGPEDARSGGCDGQVPERSAQGGVGGRHLHASHDCAL